MMETTITVQQEVATDHQPNEEATTVSVKTEKRWKNISFDINYFRSTLGKLKLVQLLLGIICVYLATPEHHTGTQFFVVVVVKSFILSLLWGVIHLLHIREACRICINWYLTEFINTSIMTILYLIAVCMQLSIWAEVSIAGNRSIKVYNITAGTFGLLNTLVYATVALLLYAEWKESRIVDAIALAKL